MSTDGLLRTAVLPDVVSLASAPGTAGVAQDAGTQAATGLDRRKCVTIRRIRNRQVRIADIADLGRNAVAVSTAKPAAGASEIASYSVNGPSAPEVRCHAEDITHAALGAAFDTGVCAAVL